MGNKGLIRFHHGDIAKSTDGSPNWSADDVIFGPGDTDRFKPDWNQLFACNCSHLLVGYRPEGDDLSVTASAYPSTPDLRWAVQPWRGKYLETQVGIYVSSGSGTFDCKGQLEGPVGTKQDLFTISTTITSGPSYAHNNTDISTFASKDWRGLDGFLNLYFRISGGATGKLTGFCSFQHNVSGRNLW